jgi:hypothetical protein
VGVFGLFVVLAFGLVIVFAVFSYRGRQKRVEAFETMAVQLGLTYTADDPYGMLDWPFALFERGDGRGIDNMLSGTWQGLEIRVFDYWFYQQSTDSKGGTTRTYYRFDCAVASVEAACSPVTIEHENLFTRIADHLAMHDIEFESEEFNKAYNVKSHDPEFANALIDARMQEWLLAHGGGFGFEVAGDRILVACRQVEPAALVQVLGTAKGFHDAVPSVVASLYPKNPPG